MKNCYDHFPVSQTLYGLFLYEIIDWIFKSFLLEMGGGGEMGKSMYAMRGARKKRTYVNDGEKGFNFTIFVRSY